jgi:hypothetical protein
MSRSFLRRVPHGKYDLGPPPTILLTAFTPTKDDTDGISVYLENAVEAAAVAERARKPATTLVVRVAEQAFIDEGLAFVPDEGEDELPGHGVIPGLRREVYEADKNRIKEIAERLARLATDSIVHVPAELQRQIPRRETSESRTEPQTVSSGSKVQIENQNENFLVRFFKKLF